MNSNDAGLKLKKQLSVIMMIGILAVCFVVVVGFFRNQKEKELFIKADAGFSQKELSYMGELFKSAQPMNADIFRLIVKLNAEGANVPPAMAAKVFEADNNLHQAGEDLIAALKLRILCLRGDSISREAVASQSEDIRTAFREHYYETLRLWREISQEAYSIAK